MPPCVRLAASFVPDKDRNDTENIPLAEDVDEYMAREVLPYAPDAWIESRKQKKGQMLELRNGGVVGYEIPFTRYFYEYTPLRPVPRSWQRSASLRQELPRSYREWGCSDATIRCIQRHKC